MGTEAPGKNTKHKEGLCQYPKISKSTTRKIELNSHWMMYLKNTIDDKRPSSTQLNRLATAASIQNGIEQYRANAAKKTEAKLLEEKHNSKIMGEFLAADGKGRPNRCHAHAIVAGKHRYAVELRAIMAWLKIGIDDPDNGCWLPESTAAKPYTPYPNAIPHSRIHRFNYFFWIKFRLENITEQAKFRHDLNLIARQLQTSACPPFVMLAKGQGLPNGVRV